MGTTGRDASGGVRRLVPSWLLFALGWWVVLFGLWFLLVDSLARSEVAAGPVAGAIATGAVVAVRAHSGLRLQLRLR